MKKVYVLAFCFLIGCKSTGPVLLNDQENWKEIANGESIGLYKRIDNEIICGDENAPPMKDVDGVNFEVLGNTNYARDSRHVYYPLSVECVDVEGTQTPNYCYCDKYVVEKASTKKTRYIGKDYAADNKNVYFRGELVSHADGKTAQLIDGPKVFFGIKDKKSVYIYNVLFKSADPSTFQFSEELEKGKYLFKDAQHQWIWVPNRMPDLYKPSIPK